MATSLDKYSGIGGIGGPIGIGVNTPPITAPPQPQLPTAPTVTPSVVPKITTPVAPTAPAKEQTVLSSDKSGAIQAVKDKVTVAADKGLRTDANGNVTYADGTLYKPTGSVYDNPEYTNSPQQDIQKVADGATTAGDFGKDANGNVVNTRTGQVVQLAQPKVTETGTTATPTATTPISTPETDPLYYQKNPELDPIVIKSLKVIDDMKASGDVYFAREMENVRQQYEQLISQQKDANMRAEASRSQSLLMSGTSRYAQLTDTGIMHEQISYGLTKISDLVAKENSALLDVQKAMRDEDYKLAEKKIAIYDSIKDKRDAAMTKVYDTIEKQKEATAQALKEEQAATRTKLNEIMVDAGKNNAPSDVIAKIGSAKTVAEAVEAAGEYLQSGSGIVGEYAYYKKDALARGLTPLTFDEYQTRDANRKAVVAKMAAGTDMTPGQQATFMRISSDFQKNAIITTAKAASTAKQIADQAIADPGNAGNQLTLLYTLVKNLDPNSAVREGELTLAQTTQSYLEKFKMSLERISNGQVIGRDATVELAKATKSLAEKWEQAGLRLEKDYKAQATVAGVGDAFNTYLGQTTRGYDNSIVDEQKSAKQAVIDYGNSHPEQRDTIKKYMSENQPDVGRPYTYDEVKQILGI